MVNSFIAKEDLESEFSVVRNEFESGENSPTGVLMKKVISTAFLWHNYGQSTIGNRSDIERVPIENLKEFYKKFYRPDNAVLMVTGKFKTDSILDLIQIKFGNISVPNTPLRASHTIEPPQDGEKRVTLSRVGDLQIVSALYHTPAGSHEDYAAIAIAENILTDQPSGRLYKALIDQKKSSSLWSFTPFTKEPSFMYINVDVLSNKSLEEAENILLSVLDNFSIEPATQEELKRAKSNILKQIDQINRNSSFLGTYMSEFIGSGDWRLSFIHRDRIENMTLDKLNEVIKLYFINTNRTVGQFTPTKSPVRIGIPHTEGVENLVKNYKGKEGYGVGEAFDVTYDNIINRLDSGVLEKSGIEYGLIKKSNRGKTVNLSFAMRNGNVNQLMNKGLTAQYAANMLNKGTKSMSRQDIQDKLSELKSSINFRGANGRVYANISSTEDNLMETLSLMSDMLKNPVLDEAELEKLKTQNLARIEQNKSEPTFLASMKIDELNQRYKKGHPLYKMTINEQIEAINNVNVKDIQAYYDAFYGISNNATLVAIGNFDQRTLKDFFENEFGDYKSNLLFTAISDKFQKNNSANENIKTPDKKNAFTRGSLSLNCSQYDDDYAALQIAGAIFGGGFLNSRIANRLRQQDGVSYGAGGGISVDGNKDDKNSSAYIYAIYAPENNEKVQLGFKEEISRFINEGITEEELKSAVNGWVQAQNVSRAKDTELSSVINNNLYYKRDLNFQRNIESKIQDLTVEDINNVIKKYFKGFDEWTVVNAGDFKNLLETEQKIKD